MSSWVHDFSGIPGSTQHITESHEETHESQQYIIIICQDLTYVCTRRTINKKSMSSSTNAPLPVITGVCVLMKNRLNRQDKDVFIGAWLRMLAASGSKSVWTHCPEARIPYEKSCISSAVAALQNARIIKHQTAWWELLDLLSPKHSNHISSCNY